MRAALAAVVGVALAVGVPTVGAGEPFEQSSAGFSDREARIEFSHLAPGVCVVKTWTGGLQVTPDVEWVYEGLCSAGGRRVRFDYCVRMARGGE